MSVHVSGMQKPWSIGVSRHSPHFGRYAMRRIVDRRLPCRHLMALPVRRDDIVVVAGDSRREWSLAPFGDGW